MNDPGFSLPPSSPIENEINTSPPPARWPAVLAWTVIWIVVGLIFYTTIRPELRGEKSAEAMSAGVDLQLEIAAKTAVGTKIVSPGSVGALVGALEMTARTPDQKMIVAIIAGELDTAKAALKRLDALESDRKLKLTSEQKQDLAALKTVYAQGPEVLDAAQRQRLIDRFGYAGKLALSFGLPDTNPLRQSVLAQGKRAMIAVFGGEITIGVLGICGVALLVTAIVLLATGTIRTRYLRQTGDGNVYVSMFAVYLLSYVLLSLLIAKLWRSESSPMGGYFLLLAVLPIAFAFGRLCGKSWRDMRAALGWHGGRGWYIEMPLGIVGYIAGLPIIAVGFLITAYLVNFAHTSASHPILSMPLNTPWQIFQLYAIASFMAPLIEETMFRGALFHHLRRRWSWFLSASLVSFIFAIIHPQGWATIPVLMSIAMVLAAIREWRGSILASMTAHAFNNGLVITLLVLLTRGG